MSSFLFVSDRLWLICARIADALEVGLSLSISVGQMNERVRLFRFSMGSGHVRAWLKVLKDGPSVSRLAQACIGTLRAMCTLFKAKVVAGHDSKMSVHISGLMSVTLMRSDKQLGSLSSGSMPTFSAKRTSQ